MLDKHYDAATIEPRVLHRWNEAEAFRAGAAAKPGAEAFSIVIPPPNVTGSLHMGHALNNTLQDVLVRFERMRGKDVLWQPGTDHAGIATQMVVERQLAEEGLDRRSIGRERFLERVWDWKAQSGGRIREQLDRLGASCDWSRERFTMDQGLSEAVREVFVRLYEEGLIYRDKRLVNWDPHFQTSISDLEVENRDVDGHMWHFKYPLAGGETYEYVERDEDGNEVSREIRDYISIATTRPETMLGDGAVAVHPDDERYTPIVGRLCEIPVGPKESRRLIPIITDEYPDPAFGSGAVKITGAHDFNDYAVAKRGGIPMYRLMDAQARMRDDGAPYAEEAAKAKAIVESGETPGAATVDAINLVPDAYRGLDRYEARDRVVADITAEGLAVMTRETDPRLGPVKAPLAPEEGGERRAEVPLVEAKPITQPFGDRSGVVIEPMLTDQWFCDAETLARPAIASVKEGRTKFVPQQWENTYFHWMDNIQPWCVSRQLWWGHRIPAWYGPDGSIFVAATEEAALQKAAEHYGTETSLERDEDVLDTWFSSALWPFSTMGWPEQTAALSKYYPTSVLSTAFDIIFFWVARMMMMGLHFTGQEPFHTVYMHPLVRDKQGQKMSKSKGNGIDPLELIDEYGADALRFTLAAQAVQGRDVRLDPKRVEGYRNFTTKLWNATRFAAMNEAVHGKDAPTASLPLTHWLLRELESAEIEVTRALETFRFNDAASAAYRFTWNAYCDWFVELAKPIFAGQDEQAKAETRQTAGFVLDRIFALLHPFMPFVTEHLWNETSTRANLLAHEEWSQALSYDRDLASQIEWVVDLVSAVRSMKAEMGLRPDIRPNLVVVAPSEATQTLIGAHHGAIARLARLGELERVDEPPSSALQIVVGEETWFMPLAGHVDVAAEAARLAKERDAIGKEVRQLEGKLANEKFVANAPTSVVEENQARLADARARMTRIGDAVERVQAIDA